MSHPHPDDPNLTLPITGRKPIPVYVLDGGGPAFRNFLTNTLCPHIEKRFDVDSSDSVLYGRSLGGLFALNTMLETPDAFRDILALSPSIWFADRRFLKAIEERIESPRMSLTILFSPPQLHRDCSSLSHLRVSGLRPSDLWRRTKRVAELLKADIVACCDSSWVIANRTTINQAPMTCRAHCTTSLTLGEARS